MIYFPIGNNKEILLQAKYTSIHNQPILSPREKLTGEQTDHLLVRYQSIFQSFWSIKC